MSGYTYSRWFSDEQIQAEMDLHCRRMDRVWAEVERRMEEFRGLPKPDRVAKRHEITATVKAEFGQPEHGG